jgi:hypothetical protein
MEVLVARGRYSVIDVPRSILDRRARQGADHVTADLIGGAFGAAGRDDVELDPKSCFAPKILDLFRQVGRAGTTH